MHATNSSPFFSRYISLCALSALLLSSCGGDGGSSSATTQSVSGIVTDPAIKNASVKLIKIDDGTVISQATSADNGSFTLTDAPAGELSGYKVVANGGTDTGTGEDLSGIELNLPLQIYADKYDEVVVTPITSLVGENSSADSIAEQLGVSTADISADPTSSVALLKASMKVMLLRKEGQSFDDIVAALNGKDGLSSSDFSSSLNEAATSRLTRYFDLLDNAADAGALKTAYQEAIIRRTVRLSLSEDLAALETPAPTTINNNLHTLATHLNGHLPTGTAYLTPNDVVATISAGNGFLTAEALNDPDFDASHFIVKLVDTDALFSDTLKISMYAVGNPLTGNEQLVVHDATTGKQRVIKTDVILGNRAFVFDGHTDGDKTVYDSRKYGIFLDPSQSKETRTGPDGRGGVFEYVFYFNNVFKRYDISNPSAETVIYDSGLFPQSLKDQQINVLGGDYTLHNNINDADNSYVELKVFDKLPDPLKGEKPSGILHAPIMVRLGDSKMVQGHYVHTLKAADGKTSGVLSFFEAVHKKSSYPSGDANRPRLQLCQADLSSCSDITAAGGLGDGKFFYQAENASYVYMAKNGTDTLYAYNKTDQGLSTVTGAKYPANFNHKIHNISGAAHGSGEALKSGFSNLSGQVATLADGADAFLKINYDGDATDPVGSYRFLGDIKVFKHTQILKLTGTTAVKMFDNGDGIDHADESDAEDVVGHANLVAVKNGKLIVEIGNYEAGNGGSCTPSDFGYGCSSVYYGYLNTDSTNKTELDTILHPKALLRYFVSRRVAPYALSDKLYVSTFVESTKPYVFDLTEYNIADLTVAQTQQGRTYFTKTAKRSNGIYEGNVLSWDGATGILKNLSTGQDMGLINGTGSVVPGDPAINSVSGLTAGAPVAGIGNLFALKADPGGHRFHLVAGQVDETNGLEFIDQVPFSSWIYE